jgi:hypothetical protein
MTYDTSQQNGSARAAVPRPLGRLRPPLVPTDTRKGLAEAAARGLIAMSADRQPPPTDHGPALLDRAGVDRGAGVLPACAADRRQVPIAAAIAPICIVARDIHLLDNIYALDLRPGLLNGSRSGDWCAGCPLGA